MNKTTLMAVALATCLGYVPAGAAEVVSSNIVGYQKVNLASGLNLLATPFVGVGTGESAEINDALSSADMRTGTMAQFWDSATRKYSTVYYYDEDSDGGVFTDDSYEECLGPGWGDIDQIAISKAMNPGDGFWIQSDGSAVNTFAGEVSLDPVTISLTQGLNLVGNPFPAPLPISKITGNLRTGTMAQFWDSATRKYVTVYYYDEDSDGGVFTDDSYEACLGPGWGDIDQIAIDKNVGSCEGFWIQSDSAATITLSY